VSHNPSFQTTSCNDCLFCKIIAKTIPATIIAENELIAVIKDIAPKFTIHYLIIPKKHIKSISELTDQDTPISAAILFMAQSLAKELPGSQAFRLLFNTGSDAGQTVFHLHAHFVSGDKISDF
jgi:histidine triad (HIT) family protein